MTRPANSPGGDNAREPLDSSVSTHDDQDVWRGERHYPGTSGVASARDDQMVHFEDFVRDGDAYDCYISHGGGEVHVCTTYDDGSIDLGALVSLEPADAQALARDLMTAANYEATRPHSDAAERGRVEWLQEVLFG